MIVPIDKNEKEPVEEMCALSNCKVSFYTMESNPLMLQAEITELNGEELSTKDAWFIGRSVAWSMACKALKTID